MKRATRLRLQKFLTLFSFLLAGVSTGLLYVIKSGGGVVPLWLMGLVGYSWIFVVFLGINQIARTFSRRKSPPTSDSK
jgi:hypothetical protein